MPYKDPEREKAFQTEYRKNNRERLRALQKAYRDCDRNAHIARLKKYRDENKNAIRDRDSVIASSVRDKCRRSGFEPPTQLVNLIVANRKLKRAIREISK